MRFTKSTVILMIALLLPLFAGSVTVRAGNVWAEPGTTAWYTINTFDMGTGLQAEMNDEGVFPNLDLVGTQVFAKVLWVGDISDGFTWTTVVDVSTGFILGAENSIYAEDPNDTSINYEVTLPEGAGLFVPFGISSATDFTEDLSSINPTRPWMPIPLYLHDDFNAHVSELSGDPDTTTSLGTEYFQVEVSIHDAYTDLTAILKWRVSDGLFYSVDFSIADPSDSTISFDFAMSLDRVDDPVGLPISVGDRLTYVLQEADWSMSVTGDFNTPDTTDGFNNAKSEVEAAVGKDIVEFYIQEIDGLYYRAEIRVYNSDTGALETQGEAWFNGFNTPDSIAFLGMGGFVGMNEAPLPFGVAQQAPDFGPGENAVPIGPVSTPDWEIYNSVAVTVGALLAQAEAELVSTISDMETNPPEDVISLNVASSTSSDPQFDFTYQYGTDAYGYNIRQLSASVDVVFQLETQGNDTWVNWDNTTGWYAWEESQDNSIIAETSVGTAYSSDGILNALATNFDMNLDMNYQRYEEESWGYVYDDSTVGTMDLSIYNYLTLQGYTGSNPTDPIATTTAGVDTNASNNLLPGFGYIVTILAFAGVAAIVKRRY